MFEGLTLFAIGYLIYGFTKEKLERPAPANRRFDWDAYWADIHNGIDPMAQQKKIKRGGYYTTKPKQPDWWELPYETIVDKERYEFDMEHDPDRARYNLSTGEYRKIEPINYEHPGWKKF